jgi:mono/diheme cytochrome c family protein
MHGIYRIASLVTLTVAVLFFVEDNITTEWRQAQNDYQARMAETAGTDAQIAYASSYEIRLRQIELPALDRVDRCVSCHLGTENPSAADWPQPLTTHSGEFLRQHDVERIGCTVCHDGQGRATTAEAAHAWADGLFWDKPVLRGAMVQSTCVRCHNGPLPYATMFERGKKLFDSRGCRGCHRVGSDGMSLGTDLTRLGDASFAAVRPTTEHGDLLERFENNINVAYIYESVRYPHAQPPNSMMPKYDFSDQEATALTVYLKGLTDLVPESRLSPRGDQIQQESFLDNGKLLYARYCNGCHGVDGRGGTLNPNAVIETVPRLDELAERLMLFEPEDVDEIVGYLREHGGPPGDSEALDLPRGRVTLIQYEMVKNLVRDGNRSGKKAPHGLSPIDMPAWGKVLSAEETAAVIAWLLTKFPWDEE